MYSHSFSSSASLDLFHTLLDIALREGLLDTREVAEKKQSITIQKQETSIFAHIKEQDMLAVNNLLAERWGGTEVGAAFADKADILKLGVLGEIIALSETPYDAFYQISRFSRLLNQSSTFELVSTSHRISMVRHYQGAELKYRQAALVGMFWALAHIALIPRRIFNVNIYPCAVRFQCAPPKDMTLMTSIFGQSLYFNQSEMSVSFKLAELKDIRRDPYRLFSVMERVAEDGLNEIISGNLSVQVKHYLHHHLEGLIPEQAILAKKLGVSVRSLQRKLASEGSSFRSLLEEVRCQKASKMLLEKKITISEIAFRLGYAEQAAFTHAFQRWFGCSPRQMRLNHLKIVN